MKVLFSSLFNSPQERKFRYKFVNSRHFSISLIALFSLLPFWAEAEEICAGGQKPCVNIGRIIVSPQGTANIAHKLMTAMEPKIEKMIMEQKGFQPVNWETDPKCTEARVTKLANSDLGKAWSE